MIETDIKESGIYALRNIVNGKLYIGSAVNLKKRLSQHLRRIKNKTHHNKKLENAWYFYGESNFEFLILELVKKKIDLIKCEQYWIDKLNVIGDYGYNISPIAGSSLGRKASAITKEKMSFALKGREFSEEHKEKLSVYLKSEKHRKIVSESIKGIPFSDEHKDKISKALSGRKLSEDHCIKNGIAHKGRKHTDEVKKYLSSISKGKPKSEVTKLRMKEAWAKRKLEALSNG